MNTVKVTFIIHPFEQWVSDVLQSELAAAGYDMFVDTDAGFEAYVPENLYDPQVLQILVQDSPEGCVTGFRTETIPGQNWNEVWEKNYFKPLTILDQVVVRAPFHPDYPACPYEIVIEPNMAFGTGNHETTSLMMEYMLTMDMKGRSVLDMGCGTGILAILASMLGAHPVTAIDTDPWAYEATVENARINHISNITTLRGDAALLGNESYDVILANIQKNVIIEDLEKYSAVSGPGGIMLLSGFYTGDSGDIRSKSGSCGLDWLDQREKNGWAAVRLRKSV